MAVFKLMDTNNDGYLLVRQRGTGVGMGRVSITGGGVWCVPCAPQLRSICPTAVHGPRMALGEADGAGPL